MNEKGGKDENGKSNHGKLDKSHEVKKKIQIYHNSKLSGSEK